MGLRLGRAIDRRQASAAPEPPARIVDGLYISALATAAQLPTLKQHGITHLLSLVPTSFHYEPAAHGIRQLLLPIDDHEFEDLLRILPQALAFLAEAAQGQPQGAALVHCQAGVSRSASVCVAHLMAARSLSLEAALALVRAARPLVAPNRGFRRQLELWQEMGGALQGDAAPHRLYHVLRAYWACKRARPVPPAWLAPDPLQAPPPPPGPASAEPLYLCAACRRPLFASANVVVPPGPPCCPSYAVHIEPMRWMRDWTAAPEAPLACPACPAVLGARDFATRDRCECGAAWVPRLRLSRDCLARGPPPAVPSALSAPRPTPAPDGPADAATERYGEPPVFAPGDPRARAGARQPEGREQRRGTRPRPQPADEEARGHHKAPRALKS